MHPVTQGIADVYFLERYFPTLAKYCPFAWHYIEVRRSIL